jgi:hypothetical protein
VERCGAYKELYGKFLTSYELREQANEFLNVRIRRTIMYEHMLVSFTLIEPLIFFALLYPALIYVFVIAHKQKTLYSSVREKIDKRRIFSREQGVES